jgi:hypothetical protein
MAAVLYLASFRGFSVPSNLVGNLATFLIALSLPLLFWAILAKAVRRRPEFLPRIYPVLKIAAWGAWGAAVLTIATELVFGGLHPRYWPYISAFSGGIQLVHSWARRKVDPTAFGENSPDGWWPSSKKY